MVKDVERDPGYAVHVINFGLSGEDAEVVEMEMCKYFGRNAADVRTVPDLDTFLAYIRFERDGGTYFINAPGSPTSSLEDEARVEDEARTALSDSGHSVNSVNVNLFDPRMERDGERLTAFNKKVMDQILKHRVETRRRYEVKPA